MEFQQLKSSAYFMSGVVKSLDRHNKNIEWTDIKPGDVYDKVFNKILEDYNIKKTMSIDDWVYVVDDDMFSFYYNNKSIKIDKDSNKIEVWVKEKLSEKEKEKSKLSDKLNYYLILNIFYYNYAIL